MNYARSIVSKIVEYYEAHEIYLIEPHFKNEEWIKNYPIKTLDVNSVLMEKLGDEGAILGRDKGAKDRLNIKSFDKERLDSNEVEIKGEISSKMNKATVIDDLVETGGTLSKTYEKLKSEDFEQVEAAVVHGVLSEGVEKARNKFDNFYFTNSIGHTFSNIDIEPLIRKKVL